MPASATTHETELARLTAELAAERAISTRFLAERDDVMRASYVESARLTAELATERATGARLLQQRNDSTRQPIQLSWYLGDYTSAFLDGKTCCERAALLASIRVLTKITWDSGTGMTFEVTTREIRKMMAQHGFEFREPGEGETGWGGYSMMMPDVPVLEQLDRLVRTHRDSMGAPMWYFTELITVLFRIVKYLGENA